MSEPELLQVALGHMLNAIIDLESGETKATAIQTLRRGIKLIEDRQISALARGK